MKFKTPRINDEFYNKLHTKNLKLYSILIMLDSFIKMEYNKEITLTEIYRSKEEFDALYAQTPEDKRPKTSPHMFWNAADIRSSDFTSFEKEKMKQFLNSFTYTTGQGKPVCIIHTITGNVEHCHVQCD